MLKKWFAQTLKKQNKAIRHRVVLNLGHTGAEQVIRQLVQSGYEAYLVGGAVRDGLLGILPKDFDVATNATPEQVKALFRRSRIIGRRFPIVHVMVGNETVEVSTFRSGKARQNELGRIVRDNTYGTLEQDAVRRDFTCNALYYDVIRHEVIDFHQGIQDIQAKRLVMIGDAAERYREDPVRVLRAVRLSGKLGFAVDEQTAKPIAKYAPLLKKEPISRLFDELLKILFSGHAQACLQQLRLLGVGAGVHPLLSALQYADDEPENNMVLQALQRTDKRLQEGKSVSIGFVLAALLWGRVSELWRQQENLGLSSAAAMGEALAIFRGDLEHDWGVPQRFSATMREIWALQPQFQHQRGSKPFRLLAQARFRAAYDFLLIRVEMGEVPTELADWWTKFQAANEAQRHAMTTNHQKNNATGETKRKRRRRVKKKSMTKPTDKTA